MDIIEFLSSKHEKLMDENTMYYAPLKMYLFVIYWHNIIIYLVLNRLKGHQLMSSDIKISHI